MNVFLFGQASKMSNLDCKTQGWCAKYFYNDKGGFALFIRVYLGKRAV